MGLLFSDPTYFETFITYAYNYVILASLASLTFFYYLLRTRAPLKEDEQSSAELNSVESNRLDKKHRNITRTLVNGNVADHDHDILESILHGIDLTDAVAAEDEAEENQNERVARERKATETEEEEEGEVRRSRPQQIIREVTVRKIILPADARYTDVENAAKRLITDSANPRKDSGTGGPDFRAAIRSIREASKRLDDDDLSPVRNGIK